MSSNAGSAAEKRVVVLAHVPPPFHGQSFMIAQMLEAMRKARLEGLSLEVLHVDCRYSRDMRSMGKPGLGKLLLAVGYAIQTVATRFIHGADTLYYAPAPGKRPAFLRDCVVLSIVRPFFRRIIFQWHAAGLNEWLEKDATRWERWLGRKLLGRHDTSIVMVDEKRFEAAYFQPREIRVIPYGIPDACPEFSRDVLPTRMQRARLFENLPPLLCLHILYLSTASREKGVFDAVEIWRKLNERALERDGPYCCLTIAGAFPDSQEEHEFAEFLDTRMSALVGRLHAAGCPEASVHLLGNVSGAEKSRAYREADVFVFPSTYSCESFGVVLVEAACFGLPCVTYQPLVGANGLSETFHRRVPRGDTNAAADGVLSVSRLLGNAQAIRDEALWKFRPEKFQQKMADAFRNA